MKHNFAKSRTAIARAMLRRLKSGKDLRRAKIRRVKAAVRAVTYENDLKIDVAADRLAGELNRLRQD